MFTDSESDAKQLFAKLIRPVKTKVFFTKYWSKKPKHIKRQDLNFYEEDKWFSTAELDRILRKEDLQFGANVDVITYEAGRQETHNPEGRAHAATVWDMYQTGCSVMLLDPQAYCDQIWRLLATLQELFGAAMGAKTCLTPPDSQGDAPHYDDNEVFVLQLEGRKHWCLYKSLTQNEKLPRCPSDHLEQEEIGEPHLECTLEPGDLLYLPSGTIHQARTPEGHYSHHLTVSTHHKNTYADLLEELLPLALDKAAKTSCNFRQLLPNDYLDYTEAKHQDSDSPKRNNLETKLRTLCRQLLTLLPVDDACSEMAKRFIHGCLPPYLTKAEKKCSVFGGGERWSVSQKRVKNSVRLEPDTKVRLMRKHILRMILEPIKNNAGEEETNVLRLYHSANNARVYHGRQLQFVTVSPEAAPAIETLIKSYPSFVTIKSLPLRSADDRLNVAEVLYDAGLLVTHTRLISEGNSNGSDGGVGGSVGDHGSDGSCGSGGSGCRDGSDCSEGKDGSDGSVANDSDEIQVYSSDDDDDDATWLRTRSSVNGSDW